MGPARKTAVIALSVVVALVVIAVAAVFVVTSTPWGHERVRRFALDGLAGVVHGHASIGRVSGNLLSGVTLSDVSVTDSTGAPFVSVDSITTDYTIGDLWNKRLTLRNAVLVRPVVVLDRPPNGRWNWDRIFPHDTTPKPPSAQQQWGDWIVFTNARVVNGRLVMRTPWQPAKGLSAAAADSVIRDVLSGKSRVMVDRVPGGFQKRIELDSVTATIPLLRLSEPGYKNRLLQLASLSMNAYPFRPPGATVRDLRGSLPFNNDSIWWRGAYAEFPGSKETGDGSYVFSSGDMTLNIHADPASFADVQWVYPRLPADGHGKLDLSLTWRGAIQDYQFSNADISIGQARAVGSFGMTLGDTLTIHDTNLRFSGIDTRTLAELIPGFHSPRAGVFVGHAAVHGGRHALVVDGDVTFDDRRAGRSRLVAAGEIGFLQAGNVRARDLRLRFLPLQVAMARTWDPTLPIAGVVTGTTTLNGSTTEQMAMSLDLTHADRGAVSALTGSATLHFPRATRIDADVTAHPVSLIEIGRLFPSAGLQGSATGPIHTRGPLRDFGVRTDLRLPDGGRLTADGTLDLASAQKGYDLSGALYTFNLNTIDRKAPATSLTARVTAAGRGTNLATLYSKVAADFSASRWVQGRDSIAFDTLSVRATVANGLAHVDSLFAAGAQTRAVASGGFGLVANRSDSLTYTIDVDSLGALNRWLPPPATQVATVPPRPGVVAAAMAQARADSARIAKRTEMQRLYSGQPPPKLVVKTPPPVPRDTLLGRLHVVGSLAGNVHDFDLHARAAGDSLVVRGNAADHATAAVDWTGALTPNAKLAASATADHVSAMGFAFDTVTASATYGAAPQDVACLPERTAGCLALEGAGGHVEVTIKQGDTANVRRYAAAGDYTLYSDRRELRLANMTLQFDTAMWTMPHPDTVQWGKAGIRVSSFDLRNRGPGRVHVDGLIPTEGVANLRVDVDSFPVGNVVELLQSDLQARGDASVHGTMRGTSRAPAFQGTLALTGGEYNDAPVPDLQGRFDYADQQLVAHVDALHGTGAPMTTVDARLPINLALSGVTGDRLLPRPMSVDVVGDSLPIDLIPDFTDLVSNVHGHAAGHVAMRGTLRRPAVTGAMTLDHGTTTITETGATITDIAGSLRMTGDTVFVDSLAGSARGPVRLTGTLGVGNVREPSFDLTLVSDGAQLWHNDNGNAFVDSRLRLTGPFRAAHASGEITIARGVIYAPEANQRSVVGPGDPGLFNVVDTASELAHQLFPAVSPLVANLTMDLSVRVNRDTWVRNREANVEIYTDAPVAVRDSAQRFVLTGVVTTERGEYYFLGKRFQIRRGSAMFIGTPEINPTLQVTGEYQVQEAARAAVNIRVLIGGTLKRLNLSLESDAQPPKTQSELLTLLAFGQSTGSLVAQTTSSVAAPGTLTGVVGAGGQYAVRRLASVALGVAVNQSSAQASRRLGTDVFDITPADVPTELGSGGINGFLNQTRFEAGKYLTPETFVSLQEQARNVGASIERRTGDGWRLTATFQPRLVLEEPTLNSQPYRSLRGYGLFVIRDWRF